MRATWTIFGTSRQRYWAGRAVGRERFIGSLVRARAHRQAIYVRWKRADYDQAMLAAPVRGVLLALNARNIRKGTLRESIRNLEAVGANVLGTTVMNNVRKGKGGYYYGYMKRLSGYGVTVE